MSDDKDILIQIGNLAGQLGITTRTIRYYEEIGLMGSSRRLEGGARTYSHDDVLRLKFILKLKELGITLKEMQELADNFDAHNQSFDTITPKLLGILDQHISKVDEKISRLSSLRSDIVSYRSRIRDLLKNQDQVA
jgi:DNA-binding transcriptional MerR regulator